ncbi:hypothetical protein CXB51_007456 [Gossypium anomalum]|uniref:DUF7745 domain-containing protein n=1 Tax=Gossypium anomalum TaxID=47600 RepID=A0A8J5ZI41_9ROSI|nr:hypothetical protein CXB51_007456 [Gossypium anomalum]
MRNEYLDKVEDNASVCTWLEKTQLEKGDSVTEGYTSELWDFTRINSTQNEFQELRDIRPNRMTRLSSCFTFGVVDLVPTLGEYTTLLRCLKIQGVSEQWAAARILQKGDGKCIPWASLRDLILAHPDVKRRVDVLALRIYGLVIFPKAMGHVDKVVTDLFDRLGKQNTPVPAILAETFRSLNACRRIGEGSHFWKVDKVPFRVFFKDYSPLKEVAATPRRDDITEERWIEILQNLREEDGVVGYTPLLVLRQYKAKQFIPATQGLAQSDFSYKGDHYKKKMREISKAWKKVCCFKILTKGPTVTFKYKGWFSKRVNDNIPRPSLKAARSMEENLRVIPSELEVIKQEFERKNLELGRKIERLKEEKMYLSLDVDVQKIEVEKVRKEKRKIEEDRDDLKTQYKKTQLSLKRAGLGKSLEQWQQEVQEERTKVEYWEKKFQEMQA